MKDENYKKGEEQGRILEAIEYLKSDVKEVKNHITIYFDTLNEKYEKTNRRIDGQMKWIASLVLSVIVLIFNFFIFLNK